MAIVTGLLLLVGDCCCCAVSGLGLETRMGARSCRLNEAPKRETWCGVPCSDDLTWLAKAESRPRLRLCLEEIKYSCPSTVFLGMCVLSPMTLISNQVRGSQMVTGMFSSWRLCGMKSPRNGP
ncbi:rh115 [macacine betaherpesvirus 3]|uniref:Rh115 n=1 Tax=Rhesus cytomegalovirus (strain 68-1) TaxID=47929 RepID=Q7TFM1_RHCM6|nr:rh115 [macacine betaherpesvirus 3]AAP50641.1 rh115 [macacine betaherpesvirus 3]